MSNIRFYPAIICFTVIIFTTFVVYAQDQMISEAVAAQEQVPNPNIETEQSNNTDAPSLGSLIDTLSEQPLTTIMPEVVPALDETDFIDPDFLMDENKSFDDFQKVTIRILDKITADTRTYDLDIGKTVAYGTLRLRPMACKKSPPIEEPESASFLQIWEKISQDKDSWVFSGWMFASSPSLSAMEHPVYDVWIIDCKN